MEVASVAVVIVPLIALGTAGWLTRFDANPPLVHRFDSLDGLRGALAIGVFLCHSYAWYGYTHQKGWRDADNHLYRFLGQPAVLVFFMLTAFLFVGRLLDRRRQGVDWLQLYVSRVFRLTPAYALAMCLLFAIVAIATVLKIDGAGTGIVLREWSDIFSAAAVWLGFTMLGMPAIDAYMNTPLIIAGVTWSLPYEWAFYLLLPIMALLLRSKVPLGALIVGLAGLFWLFAWDPPVWRLVPFVAGGVAALMVRLPGAVRCANSRVAGWVAIAAFSIVFGFAPTIFAPWPMAVLALAFFVVAAGNDLFGLLATKGARLLGRVSYSIYLLHGMILYVFFLIAIGSDRARHWSPLAHWIAIACMAPVIVALAWASQRWIEQPAIDSVPGVVRWIRSFGRKQRWPA